jgi:small subunit ribosomal protein S16
MPVKIRLQRRGRKFTKIYSIVVADSRAPRDGKYIDTLGQYNPNTNPASIELDFDKSLDWLQKGAQPTDTCRAILSYKGVMYKKHLMEGVKKGAFDEAEAEKRFASWLKEKESKIQAKVDKLQSDKDSSEKEKLAAETKVKEKRALEIEKQRSEMLARENAAATGADESAAEEAVEAEVAEEAADAPVAEETVEEAPAAEEAVEEAPVAEEAVGEAPVAEEAVEEAPAVEEPVAETPATEEAAEEPKAEDAAEDSTEEKK